LAHTRYRVATGNSPACPHTNQTKPKLSQLDSIAPPNSPNFSSDHPLHRPESLVLSLLYDPRSLGQTANKQTHSFTSTNRISKMSTIILENMDSPQLIQFLLRMRADMDVVINALQKHGLLSEGPFPMSQAPQQPVFVLLALNLPMHHRRLC